MSADLIFEHFPELTPYQQQQFAQLGDLYNEWNEKINVISRKDIETLYERHVLHSMAIAKYIQFLPGSKVLDIGTGGGFPGIPLAILFPDTSFTLVDSIGKKIKVVEEISNDLSLKNIVAVHERAEKITGTFDFVLTRAVARSKNIWNWCHDKIAPISNHRRTNGIIALKGGDLKDELAELGRKHQRVKISSYFPQPFFETKEIIYIPRF
ncbi:MAG: 16S rRNA (guanine527-N7)-methyltransferase [Paraglaciecola sp.]